MSLARQQELETLREDGLAADRQRDFAAAERAVSAWERAHPQGLEGILAFVDGLRALFGDPPVDRRPWRGSDFRM
jgi:hypothetical protein